MTPKSLAFSVIDLVERIPYSVVGIVSRLAIADVFGNQRCVVGSALATPIVS
jgi:hypothetical protein